MFKPGDLVRVKVDQALGDKILARKGDVVMLDHVSQDGKTVSYKALETAFAKYSSLSIDIEEILEYNNVIHFDFNNKRRI